MKIDRCEAIECQLSNLTISIKTDSNAAEITIEIKYKDNTLHAESYDSYAIMLSRINATGYLNALRNCVKSNTPQIRETITQYLPDLFLSVLGMLVEKTTVKNTDIEENGVSALFSLAR